MVGAGLLRPYFFYGASGKVLYCTAIMQVIIFCRGGPIAFAINSFLVKVLKSPFVKGGLSLQFLVVYPLFLKGGRGDYKASLSGKNFWQFLYVSTLRFCTHAGAPLQIVSFSYFYERNLV